MALVTGRVNHVKERRDAEAMVFAEPFDEILEWCPGLHIHTEQTKDGKEHRANLLGQQGLRVGDWIVKDRFGSFRGFTAESFAKVYEG